MKHDEKFEQRWEFRRKEGDGDTSSDENGSNSNSNTNLKLVLVENDGDQECQMRNDKVEKTKNKQKQVLHKKKSENKRKKTLHNDETTTLKDLKNFANSLIHELSVTRENMFAHMRDEMQKLVPSKPNVKKKDESRRTNKPHKGDKLRPSDVDHRLVTSSNIPLSRPEFQAQRNGLHLDNHARLGVPKNNSPEIEIGKLLAARRYSQQWLGSFSHNHQRSVGGLLGQNSSHSSCIQGVESPVPFIQGTSNGSNASSLTYCDNSFDGVGLRMNRSITRFPGWS